MTQLPPEKQTRTCMMFRKCIMPPPCNIDMLLFFVRKRDQTAVTYIVHEICGIFFTCLKKRYEFMLKETHVQAWMVVHALINGYGKTQPGCRDDLLAFLFQLSYCKVRDPRACARACRVFFTLSCLGPSLSVRCVVSFFHQHNPCFL